MFKRLGPPPPPHCHTPFPHSHASLPRFSHTAPLYSVCCFYGVCWLGTAGSSFQPHNMACTNHNYNLTLCGYGTPRVRMPLAGALRRAMTGNDVQWHVWRAMTCNDDMSDVQWRAMTCNDMWQQGKLDEFFFTRDAAQWMFFLWIFFFLLKFQGNCPPHLLIDSMEMFETWSRTYTHTYEACPLIYGSCSCTYIYESCQQTYESCPLTD